MSSGSVSLISQFSGWMLTVTVGGGGECGGDGGCRGVLGVVGVPEGQDGTLEPGTLPIQCTLGKEYPPRKGISISLGID